MVKVCIRGSRPKTKRGIEQQLPRAQDLDFVFLQETVNPMRGPRNGGLHNKKDPAFTPNIAPPVAPHPTIDN